MALLLVEVVVRDVDGILRLDFLVRLQERVLLRGVAALYLAEDDAVAVDADAHAGESCERIERAELLHRQEEEHRADGGPDDAVLQRRARFLVDLHHAGSYHEQQDERPEGPGVQEDVLEQDEDAVELAVLDAGLLQGRDHLEVAAES